MRAHRPGSKNPAHHARPTVKTFNGLGDLVKESKPVDAITAATTRLTEAMVLLEGVWCNSPQVKFRHDWGNGTGYFDAGVHDERLAAKIPMGGRVSFTDDLNRKGVVIKTTLGLAFVFQRYTDGEQGVVVANMSRELADLCGKNEQPLLVWLRKLLLIGQLSAQAAEQLQAEPA